VTDRFYTADDLAALDKEQLETIADARGLEVTGTGTDGNVLVDDLTAAIVAAQDAAGLNPAVVATVEPPVEREYVVTGENLIVFDHLNGETFRATLDPKQEARLVKAGHIKRVEDAPKPTRRKQKEA
jgi:hypothetical protein